MRSEESAGPIQNVPSRNPRLDNAAASPSAIAPGLHGTVDAAVQVNTLKQNTDLFC